MRKSIMRKVSLLLVAILSVSCLMGCNKKIKVDFGCDASDYIELGQYEGVEYVPDNRVVTEADMDEYIQEVLVNNTQWKEYYTDKVEIGDKIVVQFSATNEKGDYLPQFSAAEDYTIVLGSGDMSKKFEKFEENLVGIIPGYSKKLVCEVLEESGAEEYIGKEITFMVSIISGYEGEIPELTDAFIKEITSGKYETIADYKANYVKGRLEYNLEQEKYDDRYAQVLETIIANTKVNSYPELMVSEQIERTEGTMGVYAELNGVEIEEYCQSQFGCSVEEYSKKVVLQELILQAVVEKEGFTITTKEYKEKLDEFALNAGYSSGEYLEEVMGKEKVAKYMLLQKAVDFIYDSSVAKK